MLKSGRKPDVIAGVLAKEGIRICKETIYNYIYNHDEKGLWEYLGTKKGRKKRKKRTKRLNYLKNQKRTNIKHRTNEANKRSETGHFEADLILGGISEKKHIFTLTDRMSRKNFACFVYGKTSMEILTQSLKLISLSVGRENIKSITYDNGVEFAKFGAIETHSWTLKHTSLTPIVESWQRGTNERHNGLIRRFFPKHKNFNTYSDDDLAEVINHWNNMERKLLNYESPNDVWEREVALLEWMGLLSSTT